MLDATRECGTCTACCKTHPVIELSKKEGEWCTWCDVGKGCRIYGEHPEGCRKFFCQWRFGYGDSDDCPSKTHIVVDYIKVPGISRRLMSLWEVEEGALRRSFAIRALKEAAIAKIPTLLMPLKGPAILVTPYDIRPTLEFKLRIGRQLQIVRTFVT